MTPEDAPLPKATLRALVADGRLKPTAILAAAALAAAVLGLFLRLQEYGPESALRKFHQAVERRSLPDLQRVTLEDVNAPEVRFLAERVAGDLALGGNRFRILRTDRTPTEVRAVVGYSLPGGLTNLKVWVVERQGRAWKVSADATVRVMQDALGP